MISCAKLPRERWRRLGILYVSLIFSCGIILLITISVVISSKPGGTIMEAKILFDGDCSKSETLDLFLHLIINILSTCVLASSNSFMQIVNSPTRKEVDHAHRFLHSLEIGVSSFRNLGSLSRFKVLAWVGLFVSSVPIHLFFNSAIYSIGYEGSDWQLTISTLGFVDHTVDYFMPGASLAPAGSSCPATPIEGQLSCKYSVFDFGHGRYPPLHTGGLGYGLYAYTQDGVLNESLTKANTVKAATASSTWDLLTPSLCFDQYRFCKPRQKYRDVVVVVDEVPGWTRSEVYNFSGSAASNLSQFWDPQIPPDRLNSLWFSTSCSLWRYRTSTWDRPLCDSNSDWGPRTGCSGALGEPYGLDWTNTTKLQGSWNILFRPYSMEIPTSFGFNAKFNTLSVKHCMAEPNPEYVCKIALAPPLLLIVIGCIFFKAVICTVVLYRLSYTSLVTPGDAISSFISQPDQNTDGLATMGLADADRLEYKGIGDTSVSDLFSGPRARRWKPCSQRFKSVLCGTVWMRTYVVMISGIGLVAIGLGWTSTDYSKSAL